MLDIHSYLPAKRKTSSSGWTSFNAPCCIHNGENQDRRQRGGLKLNNEDWSYHCFNCGYTASFILGRNLSYKARKLLTWMNVPQEEIERINLESLKHKSIAGLLSERQQVTNELQGIRFEDRDIVFGELLTEDHTKELEYLKSRAVPMNYPYMRPMESAGRDSIIIPFTYNHSIVGHCQRFLDDRTPKYINDIQPGYVFGTDLQHDSWQYVLVMEGVFDALSISGLAVLHAEINDAQVRLIKSLGREVIVVPDQDAPGMKLVDRAVELGWSVSMPEWDNDVKDVNDAVIKYGKLGALLTIIQCKERSKIKIELRKKQIVKKIQ
jgi:hypothetical protein